MAVMPLVGDKAAAFMGWRNTNSGKRDKAAALTEWRNTNGGKEKTKFL